MNMIRKALCSHHTEGSCILLVIPKVKTEVEKLEEQGDISHVEEQTEWCDTKCNGHVRIFVDLTKLNYSVRRHKYIFPSVEQILAHLSGAKVLSKRDANLGVHQITLTKESALLTTLSHHLVDFVIIAFPSG